MENIFANVKERVLVIPENKGISKEKFFNDLGVTYGNFKGKAKEKALSSDVLAKIVAIYPDISAEWLLTGKGEMLRSTDQSVPVQVFNGVKDALIPASQDIPLYDLEASAGIVSLFLDHHENPIDHIRIPGIPKCDGAIKVSGDSMYPLLKSGDIVLYKQMSNPLDCIYFYGEMYIVGIEQDGDHYVVVKYIHRSEKEDHIKLVSQNQHHDPFDIPKSSIRALALVKASIRINSMK
jgi:phage repressor protein C with HTH and peptisase S24 domain